MRPGTRFRAWALAAACALGAWATAAGPVPAGAQQDAGEQRVALVTGSTSGLGREVARRLASDGYHVIVHGRDRERGEALVAEIRDEGSGSARFYRADFASLDRVEEFARTILEDYERIDVLVNNAGIGSRVPAERTLSRDGHELRFQVNYLAHYLITRILLNRIEESAPARIVNVSSGAQTAIDFDDPMMEEGYSGSRAYAQSKLALVMMTFDLARELEGTGVVVNSLHPATYMDTRMVRMGGFEPRSTVAEGARAVMNLIEAEELESGQYFDGMEPARAEAQAYDSEARAKLRRLSEELVRGHRWSPP